jgi:peptide/nickel transport system ATP-binding protein
MTSSTASNSNKSKTGVRDTTPLLTVSTLKKYFEVEHGFMERLFSRSKTYVHAVDDINFDIKKGEIFCLVGESGCGKTTTARVISGLEEKTSGVFKWHGKLISDADLKPKKDDVKTQIVFQNPYSSLNPRMKLGEAVQHPLIIHDLIEDEDIKLKLRMGRYGEYILLLSIFLSVIFYIYSYLAESVSLFITLTALTLFIGISVYYWSTKIQRRKIINKQVFEIFEKVGLHPPDQYYGKYPHAISGGERQRVAIARAIILNPSLLVLDEPTSMLDVSIRAGILDLLRDLQVQHNNSILFITHDLATARHFGDRVGVMYVGKLVEIGEVDELFSHPKHPYTKALIEAIPSTLFDGEKYELPKGEVADSVNPPSGCRFHPRCAYAKDICSKEIPEMKKMGPKQSVACHFPLIDE